VRFPVEEPVGESRRHLKVRTLLFLMLEDVLGSEHTVCSDQFVYWDRSDPRANLSPDVFVRLGAPQDDPKSWKIWERGEPHIAVEVISDADVRDRDWDEKLRRYVSAGVKELVRFDPEAGPGERLRVWDDLDGDLVERVLDGEVTPSPLLGLWWTVGPADDQPVALRLAHDAAGRHLVPTRLEGRSAEAEGRRVEAEGRRSEAQARQQEADARRAAERRVAELEAELRKRGG
jgi:Uma2 family endonuclease